jgi:hypothetical protein
MDGHRQIFVRLSSDHKFFTRNRYVDVNVIHAAFALAPVRRLQNNLESNNSIGKFVQR